MNRSRHIGKKLEWVFREIRSYLSLSDWKTYRRLKSSSQLKEGTEESSGQSSEESSEERRLVLFDFKHIAIDNVGGRYLYHIVRDFIASGYTPCYKNNYRFISNIEKKGFKKNLLKLDHNFL